MKLKWKEDGSIKSPLSRAKGLGSSGHGTAHWMNQRITAVSNLFLMIWLVWSVVTTLVGASYEEFTAWLATPLNAILMILAVVSVFYHAALGSQVIAEDYIHHQGLKLYKLIGIKFFFIAACVACVFSILKVSFGQ